MNQLFGGDIRLAAKRFFEVTGMMIEKGGFDIVGHMDKITYHGMKYKELNVTDQWFADLVTDCLELIKAKGLLLEINTKSLIEHRITYPNQAFYSIVNELEIPVVVNSDCHYPTNITAGFQQTYEALQNAGFKTLQQLINGKWQAVEFNAGGLL